MPSGIYKRTKEHGESISKGQLAGGRVGRYKRKLGRFHPSWKGGRIIRGGYVYIKLPKHPFSDFHNYFAEHRLIMEKHIGRYLLMSEIVHHLNGIKTDNRLENLQLTNRSDHPRQHPEILERLRKAIKKGQHISPETEFKSRSL